MKNKELDMFLTFFKIGATTFGGGYAMISQIKENVVDKKEWITNDELLEICAIAESTPGPLAINLATYVGYKRGKALGSFLSTLGVVLPSFIFIFILSLFLDKFMENTYVAYAFVGVKCAVAFLLLKTAVQMVLQMHKSWWEISLMVLVTFSMVTLTILSISFSAIYYLIIGAVVGLVILSISSKKKEVKDHE